MYVSPTVERKSRTTAGVDDRDDATVMGLPFLERPGPLPIVAGCVQTTRARSAIRENCAPLRVATSATTSHIAPPIAYP